MNVAVVARADTAMALRALPAAAALRQRHEVVLAVAPEAAWLDGLVPGVTVMTLPPGPRAALRLRARRLEAAVVCSTAVGDRLTVHLAGVARRFGRVAGFLPDLLLSDALPARPGPESVTWLEAARRIGCPPVPAPWLAPDATAVRRAEEVTLGGGLDPARALVAVDAGRGGGGAGRRWEGERLAHLGNLLARRHDVGIVLLGGADDRGFVDRLRLDLEAPALDLCGEVDLPTAAAVLARCDLLVAPDGPLLHLAAAVGTPTLGLFGPTPAAALMPVGSRHRAIQALDGGGGLGALSRVRVEDALAVLEAPPAVEAEPAAAR